MADERIPISPWELQTKIKEGAMSPENVYYTAERLGKSNPTEAECRDHFFCHGGYDYLISRFRADSSVRPQRTLSQALGFQVAA